MITNFTLVPTLRVAMPSPRRSPPSVAAKSGTQSVQDCIPTESAHHYKQVPFMFLSHKPQQ